MCLHCTCCPMNDRMALIVQCIDVGLVRQQQRHQRHIALDDGQMQRCEAIFIGGLQELWSRNGNTGRRHEIQLSATVMKSTATVRIVHNSGRNVAMRTKNARVREGERENAKVSTATELIQLSQLKQNANHSQT